MASGVMLTRPVHRRHDFDALDVRAGAREEFGPLTRPSVQPNPSGSRTKLERDYPAMANAIRLLWGYPEMNEYFAKLWLADGRAEPIDPEVMADLMLLARIHEDIVPARPKQTLSSIYGTAYGERPTRRDVWGDWPRAR